MALSVFISHSVAPWELGIVEGIAAEARNRGAFTFISHRDYRPDAPLPEDVRKALIGSDYLLAIATTDGSSHLPWLNREVLERGKLQKPFLIIADDHLDVPSGMPVIRILRSNPAATIQMVSERLSTFEKDAEAKKILTWLGVGGLLYLLFAESER